MATPLYHRHIATPRQMMAQRQAKAAAEQERSIDAHVNNTAMRLADENPGLPREAFHDIATLYRRQHALAKRGTHSTQVDVAPIYQEIVQKYGENGKKAFELMNSEMRPKGLLESVMSGGVKLLYDSGNGGLQWGRIAGILGGGFLGLKLMGMLKGVAGDGMIGSVLPLIAMAAATILGAKLGNMGQQAIAGSDTPAPSASKQPGMVKAKPLDPATARSLAGSPTPLSAADHVNDHDAGSFSPSAGKAPVKPLARNQGNPAATPPGAH